MSSNQLATRNPPMNKTAATNRTSASRSVLRMNAVGDFSRLTFMPAFYSRTKKPGQSGQRTRAAANKRS